MKNLKSINELFGKKSKKPESERSDKEEKILQKVINMIENTDKIESGEYKIIKKRIGRHNEVVVYNLLDESKEIKISFRHNIDVFLKGDYIANIILTKDEKLSILEKFEKAYEIQHAPKRAKAEKEKEEKIDKFLNEAYRELPKLFPNSPRIRRFDKGDRSEKEEAALQKVINMLEDTDKIESGEYLIKILPADAVGHAYILEADTVTILLYNQDRIDISVEDKEVGNIYLTDDEHLKFKERFEKAYAKGKGEEDSSEPIDTKGKRKEDSSEPIDKFLDL